METLKIALVSDWYYPKLGGVAVHMHDLALYLRERGHEVDIITNNRKTGKEDELRELGIGLVKVPGKIFPSASLNVSAFAKGYGLLEPLVRGYEVVHGHHAFTPLSLKAAMAARKLGKGSVVTTHSINYENSFTIRTMSRASYPYYRYHLTYPHRIIAVSKASREFIKRFTRVPVRIVPNGINIERFDIPVSKEEAKELLNLDGKVVLYVGRLEPRKGVGTLISAMKDVDGTLLVAGSGSMLPVLRNKAKLLGISNRVKFLGTVSYSILPLYYRASDVFVLPSLSEAFGIVLLEAMASGTPVVGTKVGGIPEIVDGCGMLVPPGNARALSSAINEILNNQNLERKLGKLGKRRVERVYDWSVVVKSVERVYRESLEEAEKDGSSYPHV
ncbi:glycosyltransferase, family 4 [Thermococcus kodakarensis KOD1]|uniref:Glycosyltransferase, family 4 n=1 Tax=Thermococcus kodakarensis (strain ATCC BAA-918 / JCM 12380 / KOD1) TaxID=69014 RepID=Q5JI45_THEKO|nr:glycosyltransferase family 4 protein [Thermococcus kodakarensis]WCN28883.1 glycosyltransferase family 4 protein [Thermococcus kodakarensis]WCN31185.1 glycosyltransferase family 4 protein [Thermococcus kodakarensis]BAD85080.1 glycosyltransferase, family 4 [Thermococcus kodakarensis KOD1]